MKRDTPTYPVDLCDEHAFAQLVEDHQRMVFAIVLQVVQCREAAQEVAQDVFIKVYRSLERFDHRAKLSTWIYRIAYNTAVSARRKMKHATVSIDVVSPVFLRESDAGYDDEKERRLEQLAQAVNHLKTEEQLIIYLFYSQRHTVEEIAHITSLSVANVKTRLHRVRKKLQEMLNIVHYGSEE